MSQSAVDTPLQILQSTFGYRDFRGQQREIIDHMVGGGDALVLMPTGGGKSLCYQIPAIARPGVGIVVSPLIALMQDQVHALRQLGIRAAYLNSTLGPSQSYRTEQEVAGGEFDLVYVAPERLVTPRFLHLLERTQLALFAIDEAHCVSQWGHDFRQDYLRLAVLHERFSQVPRIACTATADQITRQDITHRLGLENAQLFVGGFDRPNIRYTVTPKHNGRQQLLRFIESHHVGDSGIIYCMTRRRVEQTASWLSDQGRVVLPYHAGLDHRVRHDHLQRFRHEEAVIVVATIAFGMGIDKPDVRFVVHLDVPKSLEAYYQETGRAGRDGLPASAWMTYGLADAIQLRQLLNRSDADEQHRRIELEKLNAMLGYCETVRCRRDVLLRHFGQSQLTSCGNCDTCMEPIQTWDATVAAQKALSCVYRTDQKFGAGYLSDVLIGTDDQRIRDFGHDRTSTFGIGTQLTRSQWLSVYRQLVAAGLLCVDSAHGSLLLTHAATDVLKGNQRVSLRQDPVPTRKVKPRVAKQRRLETQGVLCDPADRKLFDDLRAKRLELARAQNVPPYVVFHDATLLEIARLKPNGLDQLAQISGVGQKKLEKYGLVLLETIRHSTC